MAEHSGNTMLQDALRVAVMPERVREASKKETEFYAER